MSTLKTDSPQKQVEDFIKNHVDRLTKLISQELYDEQKSAERRLKYQEELDQWQTFQRGV